jgi:predicted GIY-YIG superfamily endonuclease
MVKKALYRTQEHTMEKLTMFLGRRRRSCNDPLLLMRLSETVPEEQEAWITEQHVKKLFKEYIDTLPEEKHQLV